MNAFKTFRLHVRDSINKGIAICGRYFRKKLWMDIFKENTNAQVLTASQKKQALDFYNPYFPKIDTRFHNFYTEKTGLFYENYIPDYLYYCYIDPYFNDWNAAQYIDNKCLYPKLFPGVAQAENLLWRVNKLWYDGRSRPLTEDEINAKIIENPAMFIKIATNSQGGTGVFYLTGDDRKDVFWTHVNNIPEDIIVQKPIVQHEQLSRINSSSVNTIRTLSLLTEDGVKIYSNILRMGINGAKVDNASSGGITCGIDENGKLKSVAYTAKGKKFSQHPNSLIPFEGFEVPSFHKIQERVIALHTEFPSFRLISWDFAVREDGEPLFIEANLRYGELDFHQLNNGPLFGKDTKKILTEVFQGNKHK